MGETSALRDLGCDVRYEGYVIRLTSVNPTTQPLLCFYNVSFDVAFPTGAVGFRRSFWVFTPLAHRSIASPQKEPKSLFTVAWKWKFLISVRVLLLIEVRGEC